MLTKAEHTREGALAALGHWSSSMWLLFNYKTDTKLYIHEKCAKWQLIFATNQAQDVIRTVITKIKLIKEKEENTTLKI